MKTLNENYINIINFVRERNTILLEIKYKILIIKSN